MKQEIIVKHMQAAYYYAKLSSCNRRKVGCLIVREDRVISIGYNGTPRGWDNRCEDEEGNTLPYVFHAESNAITKLTRSTESSEGASLFVTVEPCYECAKLIVQCGIREVFFCEKKADSGREFLLMSGIPLHCFLTNPLEDDNATWEKIAFPKGSTAKRE